LFRHDDISLFLLIHGDRELFSISIIFLPGKDLSTKLIGKFFLKQRAPALMKLIKAFFTQGIPPLWHLYLKAIAFFFNR